MNTYSFIDAHRADYMLKDLCAALKINTSAYHYWDCTGRAAHEQREVDRAVFDTAVRAVHVDSDGTYGADRAHAQLRRDGWDV